MIISKKKNLPIKVWKFIATGVKNKDKAFEITEFEWEALCLLEDDIEPCYENAKLDLNFSKLTAKFKCILRK